ncbi:MAG TPA: hypothetical protein VJI69_03955, partial [Bacteroidia bacterium]|nr:hypothetical protein [Bacteroidia bacterium]
MKKIIGLLSITLTLFTSSAIAQAAASTGAAKPKQATAPKLTEKDILMCDKNWQVVSVEEWKVVTKPPSEKNKTDMLKLTQDGKFELILHGVKKSGTWSKSGQNIYFTDEASKTKFYYKILLAEAGKLKVDFFSDEEGHS